VCDHKIINDWRTGERVCVRCGLVFGPAFSSLPERNDDEESSFRRAWDLATSVRRHDRNLGTEIYRLPQSSKMSPRTKRWWNRARTYLRSKPANERRLIEFLYDIERVCSYMGLTQGIRDDLCYAAQKLVGRMRGSSRLRALVYLTFLACRRYNADRKLAEIDRAFQELFGDDYLRIREKGIEHAATPADLGEHVQAKIDELRGVLGYNFG
jgi:transcription initiation factor TFIIIB Brf1 subunit/transcription initiation factor TFIIB